MLRESTFLTGTLVLANPSDFGDFSDTAKVVVQTDRAADR
jgi:hypothetical protein